MRMSSVLEIVKFASLKSCIRVWVGTVEAHLIWV